MKKRISLLAIALLVTATLLSGCNSNTEKDSANIYVKGILDTIYLGQQSNEFLDITKIDTVTQLGEEYENGMKAEASYFSYYFTLNSAAETFEKELIDMYKNIYQFSKYEVQPSSQEGDVYYVDVIVSPIDIIYKVVEEDLPAYVDGFKSSAENGDFESLSKEEYDALYARGIVQMVEDRMQNPGYDEEQTITVEVTQSSEDGLYHIRGNGLAEIDEAIIKYQSKPSV